MKHLLTIILSCMLLAAPALAQPTPAPYQEPQDPIIAYARSIQALEFEAALDATAGSYMGQRFDLSKLVERVGSFMPFNNPVLPTSYAPYAQINDLLMRSQQATNMQLFLMSLLVPQLELNRPTVLQEGKLQVPEGDPVPLEDLSARMDPQRLRGLELRALLHLSGEKYQNEGIREYNAKFGAIYGFTQQEDFYAVYELEGSLYQNGYIVGLFEPDGGWLIVRHTTALGGTSAMGGVVPLSEDGFAALLADPNLTLVYEAE